MILGNHVNIARFCLFLMICALPLFAGDEVALDAQSGMPPVAEMRDGELVALLPEADLKALVEESLLGQSDPRFFARMEKIWFEKIGDSQYLRGRGGNQRGKVVNIAMKLLAAGQTTFKPIYIFKACLPVGETCPRNGCLMTDYGDGNIYCGCIPAGGCAMQPIIIILPFLSEF